MNSDVRPVRAGRVKLFVRTAVGLLLALTLIPSLSAWATPSAQMQSDLNALAAQNGKEFEIAFLNEMIQHHQSALEMANLVPDRAAHQELKVAAQKIIADQTKEIGDMTGWLQQWYGVSPKPGMSMAGMMTLQNLKGDAFDRQFLNMMRMHHQGAVAMAQLVPSRARHQELKTLSQNIITSQSAEIGQFESWLMSWYNEMPSENMSGMAGGHMGSEGVSAAPGMPTTGSGDGTGQMLLLTLVGMLGLAGLTGGFWLRRRGYQA